MFLEKESHALDKNGSETISDLCFFITSENEKKKLYVIEFQSSDDADMMRRCVEYGIQASLRNMNCDEENNLHLHLAECGVVYFRKPKKKSMHRVFLELTDGSMAEITPDIIVSPAYTIEDICERKIHFLLPFRIFAWEDQLGKSLKDERNIDGYIMQIFDEFRDALENSMLAGDITESEKLSLTDAFHYVMGGYSKNRPKMREGVEKAMLNTRDVIHTKYEYQAKIKAEKENAVIQDRKTRAETQLRIAFSNSKGIKGKNSLKTAIELVRQTAEMEDDDYEKLVLEIAKEKNGKIPKGTSFKKIPQETYS